MRFKVIGLGVLWLAPAMAAPRTLVVGSGDCQGIELISGVNDFNAALREKLKADLYDSDVVLDIARPRPTRSLEDVERQVESARALFYNGQNDRSLDQLKRVVTELERAPVVGSPWKVLAQALVLRGVVALSSNRKADAMESFRRVLAVEPAHVLSPDEFAPSVISQFEVAKREVARQRKTSVHVQSTPLGADVLLEGRVVGVTPLKLDLVAGTYRLLLRDQARSSFLRVISPPRESQVQIDLANEGALAHEPPLCLSATEKAAEVAALKLASTVTAEDLVMVRIDGGKGAQGRFVATRYDLRTGSILREGRIQVPSKGKPAFSALATFLITGQGSSDLLPERAAAPPPPAASDAIAEVRQESPSPTPRLSGARVASFGLLGAGVAASIAGAVVFATGSDARSLAATRQAGGKLPEPTDPAHRATLDAISRADSNQTLALSLMSGGIGLLAAGLVSFFLFPGSVAAVTPSGTVLSGTF